MDNMVWPTKKKYPYTNPITWINATPTEYIQKSSFYFSVIGLFETTSGYKLNRSGRDDYQIIFTVDGSGIIETNGTKYKAVKNHVCLIDCSKPHRYETEKDWKYWFIHISGTGIPFIYEQLELLSPNGVILNHPDTIAKLFHRIVELTTKEYSTSISKQGLLIHNMLHVLIEASQETIISKPYFSDIFSFIEENYNEQITVDDLAEIAHMSKYYFMRQFKKLTGDSPYHYIMNFRINQSKLLLNHTDKSICEIAKLCGFLDESNFINQFRKHTGNTPAEYRKLY